MSAWNSTDSAGEYSMRWKIDFCCQPALNTSTKYWLLWSSVSGHAVNVTPEQNKDAKEKRAFRPINYSKDLLSPLVMIMRDFVGQIGWPSNVTD